MREECDMNDKRKLLPPGLKMHRSQRFVANMVGGGALFAVCLVGPGVITPANAAVLDMEGFAPAGGDTSEISFAPPNFGLSTQGSFTLFVDHGHYYSATHSLHTWATSDISGTASDWFLHDSGLPLHIEHVAGNPFSVTSFEAGEWTGPFAGNPAQVSSTGNSIDVTGFLSGGGTIATTFVSDATPSDGFGPNVDFEVFTFGSGWTDLIALEFQTSTDQDAQFGYDNIVVNSVSVVPVPSAVWFFGSGLIGLIGVAKRKVRT